MQLGLWDCLRPSHLLLGQGLTRPGQPWRERTQVRVCILIDSDVSTVMPPPVYTCGHLVVCLPAQYKHPSRPRTSWMLTPADSPIEASGALAQQHLGRSGSGLPDP